MSTLDEITKEKQRVSETLARVDAQREKLTGQLYEVCRDKHLRVRTRPRLNGHAAQTGPRRFPRIRLVYISRPPDKRRGTHKNMAELE